MSIKYFLAIIGALFLLLILIQDVHTQVQINAGFNNLNIEINQSLTAETFNERTNGWTFEGAYWFRLKDYRVEFYPGIGYSQFTSNNNILFEEDQLKLKHLFWGVRVYPFNFEDDCMCPTFKKQGGLFEDGFFLSLTPHFIFTEQITRFSNLEDQKVKSNTYLTDLGAGLDIGVSEFFTLTPEVRYRFSGNYNSVPLNNAEVNINWESSLNGWYFGIGIGLRWKR
jgi:outer membrane protein W